MASPEGNVTSAGYLSGASDAWFDGQTFLLIRTVLGHFLRQWRSRTHQRHDNTSFSEQIFDISVIHIESVIDPNRTADDFGRESVSLMCIYRPVIRYGQLTCQYPQ
jgi:hypothetical protein